MNFFKEKANEYWDWTKDQFQFRDPYNPHGGPRTCFDCEVISVGFFFGTATYLWYLTRMGRIHPMTGILTSSILCITGLSVVINPNPFVEKESKVMVSSEKKNKDED